MEQDDKLNTYEVIVTLDGQLVKAKDVKEAKLKAIEILTKSGNKVSFAKEHDDFIHIIIEGSDLGSIH